MFISKILLILLFQNPPIEFRPGQVLPESPDDQAYAAASFLQKAIESEKKIGGVPGQFRASNLRFISLYNLSAHGVRRKLGSKNNEVEQYSPIDDMVKVLLFTVNQVNRLNPPVTLIRVKNDLFAIHFDSPGWTAKSWDNLASNDVYFKREWIQDGVWDYLTYWTYSEHPIMRADQFVTLATVAPAYYELLNIPNTLDELRKQLGIDDKLLTENNRKKAGIKVDGLSVTYHNRRLEFNQGAYDSWQSFDVKTNKDDQNALTQLDVIGGDKHKFSFDAGETIFQLGNGFIAGFLSDKNGKRADEVPIEIASDSNFDDRRVRAGRSCIACHDLGIKPFESDQANLLKDQVIQLRTTNLADSIALAGRYDEAAVQRAIRAGQEDFRASVENVIGEAPDKIAAQYANAWRVYSDQRVNLHTAALESGLSDEGLTAILVPSIDPNLLYLISAPGRTVPRDVWENKFNQVMLLKGKPVPKGRAELPVVSKEKIVQKPIIPDDTISIIGTISLIAPSVVGERQNASVTIRSKVPFVILSFNDDNGRVFLTQSSSAIPVTEQVLPFLFIANQNGFPTEVSIKTDKDKPIKIPIEIKPR